MYINPVDDSLPNFNNNSVLFTVFRVSNDFCISTSLRRSYFHGIPPFLYGSIDIQTSVDHTAFRRLYFHGVLPWPNNCNFTMDYLLSTYQIQSTSHWIPTIKLWPKHFSPLECELFPPLIKLTIVLQSVIPLSYVPICYHHIYCIAGWQCDTSVSFRKVPLSTSLHNSNLLGCE